MGDIYELYEEAQELKSDFVIRAAQDRKTETNERIFAKRKASSIGYVTIEIPRDSEKKRKARKARTSVSSCTVRISKKKNSLPLNLVRIVEISEADESIEWILAANLPVETSEDAILVVQYYVQRWKIERFHYILKSGCKVEEIQQRSVERILPVIAL